MYNSIKKLSVIAAVACLCSGCGKGIAINYEDKSYSTDTISAEAQIPQLDGLSSNDLQDGINHEIMSLCTEMLSDFSESAKETKEQSVFEIETTEHYNRPGFLSLAVQVDYTAKKTRQSSRRLSKNINTASCTEVELSELFADDSYIDMLNECLSNEIKSKPERYADLWEKPKLLSDQGYYINEQNLVLFYPPYELSYYERGFVEIPVALSDISGYLKPEYRNLLIH